MSSEYRFVRISKENLTDLKALAKNAFGVEHTDEELKKLFDTRAWGKGYIGYLAYSKATNETAAFYGIYPCFAEYNGKQYLIAQSGGTMTHTEHRKKNLFFDSAQKTFELARTEGMAFVYGFPNVYSYPGLMKLGWTHDGNIQSYHIVVPTFPLGYLAQKLSFLESVYNFWFKFVTNFWRTKSRPFKNSTIETNIGGVCHDEAFLSYKNENDHRFMIRVSGNLVWINQQQGSVGIGDVELINDEKNFKKVLRTLKLICFLSGSVHLRTYISSDGKLDRLFRENGYKSRPGLANCYLNFTSDLPLENFKYVYADFDTF